MSGTWQEWTDDKGQEIQSSDWDQTTRFCICESKKSSVSLTPFVMEFVCTTETISGYQSGNSYGHPFPNRYRLLRLCFQIV